MLPPDGSAGQSWSPLRKAALVSIVSVLLSWVVTWTTVEIVGGTMSGVDLFVCTTIPLCLAFPISLYVFRQAETLSVTNAALKEAHQGLERAHEALRQASQIDRMTGLLNREAFFHKAATALHGGHAELLLLDCDHFKVINDTFGHSAGDQALGLIGECIQTIMPETALSARVGGEEFAVLIPECPPGTGQQVAEKFRAHIERLCFEPDQSPHQITVSIGVAPVPEATPLERAYEAADKALYAAKRAGRNRVCNAKGRAAA